MRILGIETATDVCGSAVVRDGKVLAQRNLHQKNIHAERIMSLIDTVLVESRTTPVELDGIAVSIGPGSFTGLRIGLSVAKGLAYTLEKPIVAVPTLRALAQHAVNAGAATSGECILSLLDARRDEVYWQIFVIRGDRVEPVGEERCTSVLDLVLELGDRYVAVTGNAAGKILHATKDNTRAKAGFRIVDESLTSCNAGAVALLGERMLVQESTSNAVTLEPRYIREFYTKAI